MKKKNLFLIVLMIVAIAIIAVVYFFNKENELDELFSKEVEIPNNVYVKEEITNNANTTITTNAYKIDNVIYQHVENDDLTENQDVLINFGTSQVTIIDNIAKTVTVSPFSEVPFISEEPIEGIFGRLSNLSNEEKKLYKYEGKEKINDIDCTKVLYESTTEDKNNMVYLWIGNQDGLVYQKDEGQIYNGSFISYYRYNYTYSFDTVSDSNILNYDANNYQDYTYIEN